MQKYSRLFIFAVALLFFKYKVEKS